MIYRSLAGDYWGVFSIRPRPDIPGTFDILIDTRSAGRGSMDLTAVRQCSGDDDRGCLIIGGEAGHGNKTKTKTETG